MRIRLRSFFIGDIRGGGKRNIVAKISFAMFEYAAVTTAEMEREHGEGREKEREEEKGKKKNNSSIPTRRWERIFLAKHRLHVTSRLDRPLSVFVWLECTKNKFGGGGAPFWNHPLMHLSLLLAHLSSSLSYSCMTSFCHIFSRLYRVSDSFMIVRFKSVASDFISRSSIKIF